MKKRTVILIALILLLPLIALTWTMVRLAKNEQMLVRQRFSDVLEGRLEDVNSSIVSFYESLEPDLNRITSIDDFDIQTLRKVNQSEPRLFQLFVLDQGGELLYPNPAQSEGPLSGSERKFLIEAARMFTGQDLEDAVASSESTVAISRGETKFKQLGYNETDSGKGSNWFVWYWERGLNLIYWQRRPSGKIVGCALNRSRLIADLIANLPDTDLTTTKEQSSKRSRGFDSRIRLVNAAGATVYQWGRFEPAETAAPVCEIPVAEPLASWRLQCFVPDNQLVASSNSSWLGLAGMLAAVSLVIAVAGYLLVCKGDWM